ncbi:hypothetical protein DV736_g5998, partial [Chaetothyriales sp. CBS 134916]
MPLEVRAAVADDAHRVPEMEYLAYKDDALSAILFPGPMTAYAREERTRKLIEQLQSDPLRNRWMKVIDTDRDGEMVAFSNWVVHQEPPAVAVPASEMRTTTSTTTPAPAPATRTLGPGCNVAVCEEFWGGMHATRLRNIAGWPHVLLGFLVTHPSHQRRRAGRKLVDWGLKMADQLQLPAMLNSTPNGHKLYLDCGLRDVERSVFDSRKYGGQVVRTTWFMERPVPVSLPSTS